MIIGTRIESINKQSKLEPLWYLALLVLLSITLATQYLAKEGLIELSNYYIPDSNTYELRVFSDQDMSSISAHTYNIFNRFLYDIGAQSFLVFNASLLFMMLNLCRDVFQYISPKAIYYSRIAIVLNPYFLISVIGPNKEIILTFICLLFWKYFLELKGNLRFLILTSISLIPLLIRPVAFLPLFISLIIYPYMCKFNRPILIILVALAFYFVINSTPIGNQIISSLEDDELTYFIESRIFDIANQLRQFSQHILFQYPAFIAKTVIILFGFIIRPLKIFEIPLPLLDVGYSCLAYLILPFNLSLIIVLFRTYNKRNKSLKLTVEISMFLFFTITCLLTVILNSTLTFRYILPYTPFIFSLFDLHYIHTKRSITLISILCILLAVLASTFYSNNMLIPNIIKLENEPIPKFLDWL